MTSKPSSSPKNKEDLESANLKNRMMRVICFIVVICIAAFSANAFRPVATLRIAGSIAAKETGYSNQLFGFQHDIRQQGND